MREATHARMLAADEDRSSRPRQLALLFACGHASAPAPARRPRQRLRPHRRPRRSPPRRRKRRISGCRRSRTRCTRTSTSRSIRRARTSRARSRPSSTSRRRVAVLWLNADEITVDEATLNANGTLLVAKAITPKKGYLGLVFDRPLPVGKATLAISYRGKAHKDDGDGIYRAQEGRRLVRVHPVRDRPTRARRSRASTSRRSRSRGSVTIHTKKGLVALSNTPIEQSDRRGERHEGDAVRRDQAAAELPRRVRGRAVRGASTPARRATVRRSGSSCRRAAPAMSRIRSRARKRILDALEDYFGTPYPYPKLDMLAVSVFNAGAMENPGLITCRQSLIVTKPQDVTPQRQGGVRDHRGARDGAPVVRRQRHDGVVGRHVAQRVVRELDGGEDRHPARADVGRRRSTRSACKSGVMGQDSLDSARADPPADQDPERHRERVRRHHLREGRGRADDDRARDRRPTCSRRASARTSRSTRSATRPTTTSSAR